MNTTLLLWIIVLPLLGAALNGILLLCGKRLSQVTSGTLASLASLGAFAASVQAFFMLRGLPPTQKPQIYTDIYSWISVGSFQIDLNLLLDPLSAVLLLVVTSISVLVHIYSMSYMQDDPGAQRYFCYLNLFLFATLLLILADGPVVMLLGWQGVGLSSYLLIGFWFEDTEKAKAGMKAFVIQRIGDLGFLIGIFVIFWAIYPHLKVGESLSFETISKYMNVLQDTLLFNLSAVEVAGICLFIGVIGKSAQIPLHVWLPDALTGPTPISAMLHAATTTLAGVYLIARMNFLYSVAPTASGLIAGVGAFSALLAASVGLFQNDIKKVLAYSTISQVGFMFLGLGVGAYTAGVFHLVTHAFFKALLFLSAGSVILSLQHEQDIRKMGGLFRYMKLTGITFLIGTLASIGFPGFSGFFSQNSLLWQVFATQHTVLWVMGLLATVLTAFYMTRLFCLTFLGELRTSPDALMHIPGGKPQESPAPITWPLLTLAFLSAVGGLFGIPYFLTHKNSLLAQWLTPVFAKGLSVHPQARELLAHQHPHLMFGEGTAMGLAVVGMLLGAGAAFWLYAGARRARQAIERETALQQPNAGGTLGLTYRMLYNKYYVDEAYDAIVTRPVQQLSRDGLWPFDQFVVDGIINLMGRLTQMFSRLLSWVQTGNLRVYLYAMVIGLASLLLWLVLTSVSLS